MPAGATTGPITVFSSGVGATSQTFTVTGTTSGALQFVPVTPCRIADTRLANGTFGGPVISGGTMRTFPIPQSARNIPSSALAYSLNVTVVPVVGLGYLTAWPAGQPQPNTSTLSSDGRVKAIAAVDPRHRRRPAARLTSSPVIPRI